MARCGLREVERAAHGHAAGMRHSQDGNPGLSDLRLPHHDSWSLSQHVAFPR